MTQEKLHKSVRNILLNLVHQTLWIIRMVPDPCIDKVEELGTVMVAEERPTPITREEDVARLLDLQQGIKPRLNILQAERLTCLIAKQR